MELTSEELILARGTADEVDDFVNCDRCVIVDWRADPEEVIEAFQAFLPDGYFRVESLQEEEIVMRIGTQQETIPLEAAEAVAIPLANALRRYLAPAYGAMVFRDCLASDTACYFVRHASWWEFFRATHPDRFAGLFVDGDHE
jgi:hypothetical protein